MALEYDPRSFEPFRQSIQNLLAKVEALLIAVQQCADVVGRINELANLRDRAQEALHHPDSEWTPEETTRRKEELDCWNQEIDELYRPFARVENERRVLVRELQNVLNSIPIDPPQLREVREEIERLELLTDPHLGMRRSYEDLVNLQQRLAEFRNCLPGSSKQVPASFPTPDGATWKDVNIRFLSDHMIQVTVLGCSKAFNYAEAGFENRKTQNPNYAWNLLRQFAGQNGQMERPQGKRSDLTRMEKDVQAIRKRFKELFKIPDDPFLPYRQEKCYQTIFKISFPQADRL